MKGVRVARGVDVAIRVRVGRCGMGVRVAREVAVACATGRVRVGRGVEVGTRVRVGRGVELGTRVRVGRSVAEGRGVLVGRTLRVGVASVTSVDRGVAVSVGGGSTLPVSPTARRLQLTMPVEPRSPSAKTTLTST
jgi:UDP-3-O-[3-hydroxymyristoyl] glucosamine N-acyltransferase